MSLEIYKDASFFKVMFDLSSELRIPVEFVKKYGEIIPDEAILMGDDNYGKCWKVKIKPFDDRLCFANGWPKFVKDNSVSQLDFVVFILEKGSTVRVTIYGKDGVKKPLSSLPWRPRPSTQGEGSDKTDDDDVADIKSFTTVLNKIHHKYCLNIPMAIAKETGILAGRTIKLKNKYGKEWAVKITTRKNDGRIGLMTKDWRVFWEENNLSIGTKLIFTFDTSDCATWVVTIKRLMGMASTSTGPRRGRGRPRKYV